MAKYERPQARSYRSIWISDVHLGTRECRAEYLLDFLHSTDSKYLYLVGDIIDLWGMKKGMYWKASHNEVVRTILKKAAQGTRVIYIPGNHDELFRDYAGLAFGAVQIQLEATHMGADGRRHLVVHGDQFDSAVKCGRVAELVGTMAYDWILALNRWLNAARKHLGFPYWSLASFLKARIQNASAYMDKFDRAVVLAARQRGTDGLICGHIHRAEIDQLEDVQYCNTGDWVESCTALVEQHNGAMELLHWSDQQHVLKQCHSPRIVAEAA